VWHPSEKGIAMNAISNAVTLAISETKTEVHPIRTIAVFCGLGLVVSLCLAISGFDLAAGLS
jgi:hypothetical protein